MKNISSVVLFVLVATTIGCRGPGVDSSNAGQTPRVLPTPNLATLPMPPTSDHLESGKRAKKDTDEQLLDESEAIASRIQNPNPEDRADYLIELCRVSGEIRSPKAKSRCVAAYEFASELLDGCDREKAQAKSVAALSRVDAILALELLRKLPNPCERGSKADKGPEAVWVICHSPHHCGQVAFRVLLIKSENLSLKEVGLCGRHLIEACAKYPVLRQTVALRKVLA